MQNIDPAVGPHGIPNRVCTDKTRETALVDYKLNGCGYRMEQGCGPPAQGTYRIVMIGSSIAMGVWVPREKSVAALLQQQLSQETGHTIEVYNESMLAEHPQVVALRFNEVLSAKPNMVLWILTSYDLDVVTIDPRLPYAKPKKLPESVNQSLQNLLSERLAVEWQKIRRPLLPESSIAVTIRYLRDQSQTQAQFVQSHLQGTDSLRSQPSEAWSKSKHPVNPSGVCAALDTKWRGERNQADRAARVMAPEDRRAEKQRANGAGVLPGGRDRRTYLLPVAQTTERNV
jgi:hypothetical protein